MGIEVRLVGSVAIQDGDGVSRNLTGAQARLAFARLTLERDRGTTRDELADTVWPDRVPATWNSALRTLVSRLRRFLVSALMVDRNPIVAQGGRYLMRLPADVQIDVELAERAIAEADDALKMHRHIDARRLALTGVERLRQPLLPDCHGEWVTDKRAHVNEVLLTGLEVASNAALALNDLRTALVLANEAVTRSPLRESAHRCCMAVHAASGNRAEALRAYQRLRRALGNELGVSPAPETEAAYLALLGSTVVPGIGGSEPQRAGRSVQVAPFVGRHHELDVLREAWANAVAGFPQLISITGEAGSGKTRLAVEVALRAAIDGGLVLFGRCDQEAGIPYQPLVEAIDSYLAAMPVDELPALSPTAWALLATVFPSVQSIDVPVPPPARPRLFDAVSKLLISTTRDRPVFLVLDDMHRADDDTWTLLRQVLGRSRGVRVMVVVVARDDLHTPSLRRRIGRSLDDGIGVRRIPVLGLRDEDVLTLVEHMRTQDRDAASLAHDLVVDTAGNPRMVLELLTHLKLDPESPAPGGRRVPPGIIDFVDDKLALLGRPSRRLLEAAAIAGRSFGLDVAAMAAGLDEVTALDALDEVMAVGLIAEVALDDPKYSTGAHLRFVHAIVPRALRDNQSHARQRYLRTRIGQLQQSLVAGGVHRPRELTGANDANQSTAAPLLVPMSTTHCLRNEAQR